MKTVKLTGAQRRALDAFHRFVDPGELPKGLLQRGEGVSRSTLDALVDKGLAEMIHDSSRKRMARAGWTGREYTEGSWSARLTDAGLAQRDQEAGK